MICERYPRYQGITPLQCMGLLKHCCFLLCVAAFFMASLAYAEQVASTSQSSPQLNVAPVGVGLGRIAPGDWGGMQVTIRNPASEAFQGLATLYLADYEQLQFARSLWVPAGAERRDWIAVRMPSEAEGERAINTIAMLLDGQADRDRMLHRQTGMAMVAPTVANAVLLSDDDDQRRRATEAILSKLTNDQQTSLSATRNLPPMSVMNQSTNAIFVGPGEHLLTPAQQQALREWLVAGGMLWIMLDGVDVHWPEDVLGNDWALQVVDRPSLTTWTIENGSNQYTAEHEQAESFVRVLDGTMQVIQHVDDWPASLVTSIGKGLLVVTTIGPKAWINDQGEALPTVQALTDAIQGQFQLRGTQQSMATRFQTSEPTTDWLEPIVTRQIGGRVIHRETVALILLAYAAVLLLAWWMLRRTKRVERVGIVCVASGILFGGILVGLGFMTRQEVPRTISVASMASYDPGQQVATVQTHAGIYSPNAMTVDLRGEGNPLWFDRTMRTSGIYRLVWNDIHQWVWRGLNLPSGSILAGTQTQQLSEQLPAGVLSFHGQGALVSFREPMPIQLEDTVLAGVSGVVLVQAQASSPNDAKAFVGSNVVRAGQYIEQWMAGDMQMQRNQIYRNYFERRNNQSAAPRLIGWTRDWRSKIEMAANYQSVSETLLEIPLTVQRPDAGTRVDIPSAFFSYEVLRRPNMQHAGGARNAVRDRVSTVMAYDAMNNEWLAITQPGAIALRFGTYEALLPLTIESITLHIDVSALGREVRVWLPDVSTQTPVETWQGSTTPHVLELRDLSLQVDAEMPWIDVVIEFDVLSNPMSTHTWQLRDIALGIQGTVVSPQE